MISSVNRSVCLVAFAFLAGAAHAAPAGVRETVVLCFGDSITAGYGLAPEEAYPALLAARAAAAGLSLRVVNGGLSGDTTAAGAGRLAWALKQPVDVLVLALGGNDGLRGIPPETTRKNLQAMIDEAKRLRPGMRIILAGMRMPANYGPAYTKAFAAVFPDLARKNKLALIPFLLEGVGGVPEMNLPDRIHPTAEGQKRVAENVWAVLGPLLRDERRN